MTVYSQSVPGVKSRIVMKNYRTFWFFVFSKWKLPDAQMNGLSDVLHRKKEIHDDDEVWRNAL